MAVSEVTETDELDPNRRSSVFDELIRACRAKPGAKFQMECETDNAAKGGATRLRGRGRWPLAEVGEFEVTRRGRVIQAQLVEQ